jgi:hypothetical protein
MEFLNVLKRLVLPINQKHKVPYDAALETFYTVCAQETFIPQNRFVLKKISKSFNSQSRTETKLHLL